jgi:excisionase family DNA binding protein
MGTSTKLAKTQNPIVSHSISAARLLTPAQAAEVLGVPEGTLAQWRSQHRGPAFIKLEGRLVRYHARDLETYIGEHVVRPVAKPNAERYALRHENISGRHTRKTRRVGAQRNSRKRGNQKLVVKRLAPDGGKVATDERL